MESYINNFTNLISNCPMENTYKMSWCRALVEHSHNDPNQKKFILTNFQNLFSNIIGINLYFNLEQGPNNKKDLVFIK